MGPRSRQRLFAAWYFCIGAGFLLLGIRAFLLGAVVWTVVLRWVIAAGFVVLGWLELHGRQP
jgi:hypothetical protein